MSATAHCLDGDDDEFDSLFDDQHFLDPELEESLAHAEATYTASQAVQQCCTPYAAAAAPASNSSFRLDAGEPWSRSAIRKGTFVEPAAKKQRLHPRPSSFGRVTAAPPRQRELEVDQVIVRDLREHESGDNDDEQWWAGNNALDQVEEEAIRMSQQLPPSQLQHQRQNSVGTSHKPPDTKPPPLPAATTHNAADNGELAKLQAQVERLRSAQKAQQEIVDKLKQEAYRKSGEVAVVRQNLNKLNQENIELRERKAASDRNHKIAIENLRKEQEQRLQRLETETAFRRVEQDTSRRIWPSSVARLPPIGLGSVVVDRRQESQVRAGLTTPTKQNRFGVRGSGESSGSRQRYDGNVADREEPGTPSRSAVKGASKFPKPPTMGTRSGGKSKAFKGLQNSFADFAPVQDKLRQHQQQQRMSPTKTMAVDGSANKGRTLAPADWDADQSMEAGMGDEDQVVMADDHSPTHKSPAGQQDQLSPRPELERLNQMEHNYLAAVSEMLDRRTTIVSLLLSHASPPAAAPTSYPTNRFNPTGSHPLSPSDDSLSSNGTLSRLISANLPSDCPKPLVSRYRHAVESLLTSLGRAKVMEREERNDALHFLSVQGNAEEVDFSSATMHLSHAIASSLMAMGGLLLRLCQTDLLVDVLRLVGCLVALVPRFWMDLQSLQVDAGQTGDEQARCGGWTTPIEIREILVQCIHDCRPSHGDDDAMCEWKLSSDAREDLLLAAVSVLEAMSRYPDASLACAHHPLRLLARPGVLHKLLHPDRSSHVIGCIVRMLSSMVSNAPLVHECLASKADTTATSRSASHGLRAKTRFPVLELLVKHLVDRRFDRPQTEWHPLHCAILTFLSQAALKCADTLVVLADSAALLAALIRCLSLDSDFLWLKSRPSFLLPHCHSTYKSGSDKKVDQTGADIVQVTERIVMDTRLLNLLYNYPLPLPADTRFEQGAGEQRMSPISLATKLDQPETYSMLNGIRQSFVVALSRVAFCSEPDWIGPERKLLSCLLTDLRRKTDSSHKPEAERLAEELQNEIKGLDRVSMLLEAIADVAGDLADIVLSPDEIDSVYDLLASEEDEEEAGEGAGEGEMDVDSEELQRATVAGGQMEEDTRMVAQEVEEEEEMGSETESEPELDTSTPRRKKAEVKRRGGSKSVSPTKGDKVDVIVVDDSD
ncbi:hypothetical protein NDA10_001491 [Ustilago hordei]|uniref:Uncharacterized protein n=1 Tax=Ustilago hordei TaxID=120017 RepID=I2FXN3_USTHO|nr:uncharacterized protein UHO2_00125 [Ustilago hordei]KAJ1043550.1 hypothetical protein NDA10_001491 [Ustilago hordei]KAJ1587674.1 hypothetical protein NDA15_007503 [Ustilago hordei]KAJ1590099.1 hypothetical protein NDA12_004062 [Ustilago hordei]CCF51676.1 uncharacterized protein UHOR_08421 [Ustilago hordei]SYW81601.1 uncharacterized protein UHO2_00125 [Ustilago hordei]